MPASLPRPIFGGAISLPLPMDYIDASELRQIPDNQEVFLSPNSNVSVIMEVLRIVDEGEAATNLWEAAKYHFSSLAHDNAALSSSIVTPPTVIPAPPPVQTTEANLAMVPTPKPVVLVGTQTVHKFSHDPSGAPRPGHEDDMPDAVYIALALWRVNIEIEGVGRKRADLVLSVNVPTKDGNAERDTVEEWFTDSVPDVKIVDWNLFGTE